MMKNIDLSGLSEEELDTSIARMQVVVDVLKERRRQEKKWGEQNHSLCGWIGILTEEVGEAAKEAVDLELGGLNGPSGSIERFRTEMIQMAAVAVQIVEALDRERESDE